MRKIAVGFDAYGKDLGAAVIEYLTKWGKEIVYVNEPKLETPPAYYTVAKNAATMVAKGEVDGAILVCGSGMGMAIVANKIPGVRAAVCENAVAAQRARSINNANVLTLGEFVTHPALAPAIIDAWLDTEFTSGWGPDIRAFLCHSMGEIEAIEKPVETVLAVPSPTHVIVTTTIDNESVADGLARQIVERRFGACVQIMELTQSVYRWDGSVRSSKEWRLDVKTTREQAAAVIAYIKLCHHYSIPEIVVVPITGGSADYLRWVRESVES